MRCKIITKTTFQADFNSKKDIIIRSQNHAEKPQKTKQENQKIRENKA